MSKTEADRFHTDLAAGAPIRATLEAMPNPTADGHLAAIRAGGYDVTADDFAAKGAMADSEMEGVAGGVMSFVLGGGFGKPPGHGHGFGPQPMKQF